MVAVMCVSTALFLLVPGVRAGQFLTAPSSSHPNPLSVKHTNASAVAPSRPELLLTFEVSLSTDGTPFHVAVDSTELAIATRDLSAPAGQPHDGAILDFVNGWQFQHQRFYDELVCYKMNLNGGGMQGSRNERVHNFAIASRDAHPKRFAARSQFREVLGQIFGAPLELYAQAVNSSVADAFEIAGRKCQSWSSSQEWSMMMMKGEDGAIEYRSRRKAGLVLPAWLLDRVASDANLSTALDDSHGPMEFVVEFNASFCVSTQGELLGVNSTRRMTMILPGDGSRLDNLAVPMMDNSQETVATSVPLRFANPRRFRPTRGVAGKRCVDLTPGSTGAKELGSKMNDAARLARINSEAAGQWEAEPYHIWDGMTVQEIVPSLGTEIKPLRLGLTLGAVGANLNAERGNVTSLPSSFDSRASWPQCTTIGMVRNQGQCGSCWAFSATSVLADRFCISASARESSTSERSENMPNGAALLQTDAVQRLSLSPEHLVDCDHTNAGCSGGRLDDAWNYLRDHGVAMESCTPYKYCPFPNEPSCAVGASVDTSKLASLPNSGGRCSLNCADGTPKLLFRAAMSYAAARPADVVGLQRELLAHGPVQVAFFVFSDFHSYRRGIYARTPSAYGPLGGHAVRLLGWGAIDKEQTGEHVEYWLAANSWSPHWGLGGFFKIRRGVNECGIETTPAAGLPRIE